MATGKPLTTRPKKGDIVKFHAVLNGKMAEVLGRVTHASDNDAFIASGDNVYSRFWTGLVKPSKEEEVLWKLEQ